MRISDIIRMRTGLRSARRVSHMRVRSSPLVADRAGRRTRGAAEPAFGR